MFLFVFGFTGTLEGSKTHELQCRAWFGTLVESSTTRQLMDRGIVSSFNIRCCQLTYDEQTKKLSSRLKYQEEIDFLIDNKKRNDWLLETAMNQNNNTLLLFNYIDKHGDKLFERAQQLAEEKNKTVLMITGSVEGEERERIRRLMETRTDIVLFASYRNNECWNQH